MEQEIVGMIYPINKNMNFSIINRKTFVFPKFAAQEKLPKYLQKGKIILFYFSGNLLAEGTIERITLLKAKEVLNKYKNKLLATEDDFRDYIKDRDDKLMAVFRISSLNFYKKNVTPLFPVSMSGRYIKENEYRAIIN